jgi:hypothetical protein
MTEMLKIYLSDIANDPRPVGIPEPMEKAFFYRCRRLTKQGLDIRHYENAYNTVIDRRMKEEK